jgi:hypothetical protein
VDYYVDGAVVNCGQSNALTGQTASMDAVAEFKVSGHIDRQHDEQPQQHDQGVSDLGQLRVKDHNLTPPNYTSDRQVLYSPIDPDYLQLDPPAGSHQVGGRGVVHLRKPAAHRWRIQKSAFLRMDLSLKKNFPVREGRYFQIRGEAQNAFNFLRIRSLQYEHRNGELRLDHDSRQYAAPDSALGTIQFLKSCRAPEGSKRLFSIEDLFEVLLYGGCGLRCGNGQSLSVR